MAGRATSAEKILRAVMKRISLILSFSAMPTVKAYHIIIVMRKIKQQAHALFHQELILRVVLELHVADDDMGKVIGKQGRIAKAIRTVVKAAASHENKKVVVEIV